jgi:FkbM family methyltransferase
MNVVSNLVYDVGLHDGTDTEYYLHKGYNVIAIDANPNLIKKAEKKYEDHIQRGKLVLLNVAISDVETELAFSISAEDQFSSLNEEAAKRGSGIRKKVIVSSKKLSSLFREYGIPMYCKIDIEGYDAIALQTLDATQGLPQYISVETEMVPFNGSIEEKDIFFNLNRLQQLGYTKFKFVNQDTLTPLEPCKKFFLPAKPLNYSLPAKASRFLKRKLGFAKLPAYQQHLKDIHGYTFVNGSSGPFGESIEGDWYDYDTAKQMLLQHRNDYHALETATYFGFWCDWHAKLG